MTLRIATFLAALAALLAFAVPVRAAASARPVSSANWSGYAVSRTGVRFRRVASTWVQPAASCAPGPRRYSSYWIGLGGFHSSSDALEQIGTQVNCSSLGEPVYSAWYELVPAAPVHVALPVHPGDTLSASVTVTGHTVRLFLANLSSGGAFTKQLSADHVDVSSAEWIVEAPSSCDSSGCQPLPLANFGSASFAGASATSTDGHRGTITDPAWATNAITLSPDTGQAIGTDVTTSAPSTAAAIPGTLSPGGDGFTVAYQDAPLSVPGTVPLG